VNHLYSLGRQLHGSWSVTGCLKSLFFLSISCIDGKQAQYCNKSPQKSSKIRVKSVIEGNIGLSRTHSGLCLRLCFQVELFFRFTDDMAIQE